MDILSSYCYDYVPKYNADGVYQWDRIEEVLKHPTDPPVRYYELRCKNGNPLWVELHAKVLTMPKTNKLYSICVAVDITDRRTLGREQIREQQLRKTPQWFGTVAMGSPP